MNINSISNSSKFLISNVLKGSVYSVNVGYESLNNWMDLDQQIYIYIQSVASLSIYIYI